MISRIPALPFRGKITIKPRFNTVLVRSDDLGGKEHGGYGDANATLLGVAAVPVLEGSRS